VRLSRRAVFARDGYRCQYCGSQDRHLTVDHIVPRAKGGGNTWENLVAACKRCNNHKGGRTLEQCGLNLRQRPTQPHFILPNSYPYLINQELDARWLKYLEYYLPRN
jgi:5-methylcytosine-specific restriction endonuclease McrA